MANLMNRKNEFVSIRRIYFIFVCGLYDKKESWSFNKYKIIYKYQDIKISGNKKIVL